MASDAPLAGRMKSAARCSVYGERVVAIDALADEVEARIETLETALREIEDKAASWNKWMMAACASDALKETKDG